MEPEPDHVPVLLEESLAYLAPARGGWFIDCTVGLGGHARAILEAAPEARVLGIDRDRSALRIAARRLEPFGSRVRLLHGNFGDLEQLLVEAGVSAPQGLLADLGVSSLQLERPERGFSFRLRGPLDMRMDPSTGMTAFDVLNRYGEEELARILRDYGEERRARRVARVLVEARRTGTIDSTARLRELVAGAVGSGGARGKAPRIDPATRAFQALRIEVNQELQGLRRLLDSALRLLESDGRLVVISYHSLEDRMVKGALRAAALGEVDPVTGRSRSETRLIEVLTRRPVRPQPAEVAANPRSRSARLRAARRL